MTIQLEGMEVVGVYRVCDYCGLVKPLAHFSTKAHTNRLTGKFTIYETGRLCAACRSLRHRNAQIKRDRAQRRTR